MASDLARHLYGRTKDKVTEPGWLPWAGMTAEDVWYELSGDDTDDVTITDVQNVLDKLVQERTLEKQDEKYYTGAD